jgi:group I intron endonuclease
MLLPKKDEWRKAGIYKITCIANAKFYIGSAKSIYRRIEAHIHKLKHKDHHSKYLQNCWNKYGEEAFVFEFLEEVSPERELLLAREQYYLDLLQPEFNTQKIAGSNAGITLTEEHKQKISKSHMGKIQPESMRRKISELHKGRKRTEEEKAHLSKLNKGRKGTQLFGPDNAFYGKTHSEETKKLLAEKQTGRRASPETKEKMSKARMGIRPSEETRKKRSESMKKHYANKKMENEN